MGTTTVQQVVSPVDGSIFAEVPLPTERELDAVLSRASAAQRRWAGTPLAELQAELARDGMWAPLVAPWPESTVGGMVATNWNAPPPCISGKAAIRSPDLSKTAAQPTARTPVRLPASPPPALA